MAKTFYVHAPRDIPDGSSALARYKQIMLGADDDSYKRLRDAAREDGYQPRQRKPVHGRSKPR